MNRLVGWFAANPVAANLLMGLIAIGGLLGIPSIRQEAFPKPSFDLVSITVEYPEAAPDEVEESICIRIEEAIHGIQGIRRIRSTAARGFANVTAEVTVGADAKDVLERVRTRVDAVDNLPEDAERPIVEELVDDTVLMSVVVFGKANESTLRSIGERIRDGLLDLPEIESAELASVPPYEISIEVPEASLRRHGLTFDDVADAVRASSIDLPGGTLKTPSSEIPLRTQARARTGEQFERIVLLTGEDGTRLLLGDVSRVVDGFGDSEERARFDGQRAAVVRLLSGGVHDAVVASRVVHDFLERVRPDLPPDVHVGVWNDESRTLESRRDLLLRNAAQGFVLVIFTLAMFLRARQAFWVSLGAPISFLGTLFIMALLDVSINMMSLFAFIMALGLVVDDAIVVGENVSRHADDDARGAAARGTQEVAMPVTIAVLTTVLFMVPALGLPTFMGKLTRPLIVVAISCLLFSLVESLLVLPAHLAHSRRDAAAPRRGVTRALGRLQTGFRRGLDAAIERRFRPLLETALRHRAPTLALAVVPLMMSGAVVAGGWVPFTFLPEVESDVVTAELVLPEGTPAEVTDAALEHIEQQAFRLQDRLEAANPGRDGPVFEHVLSAVGDAPDEHDDFRLGSDGSHVGRVRIQLAPGDTRLVTSLEVETAWRQLVGPVPLARALRFTGSEIADEPAIDIELAGQDLETLRVAAQRLAEALSAYPGVREVSDSLRGGRKEVHLGVKPEGEAFGITLAELSRQVRQGFYGEEAQRVQRGRDDVPVMVRYPAEERRSFADLESVWIRTPEGGEVPFESVATAEVRRGYSSIERTDRRRTVNVTADIDATLTNANELLAEVEANVLPGLLERFPEVQYAFEGLKRDEREMIASLLRGWVLAVLGVYALLAIPLRSYLQPFVILAAVPFGFLGAVVGHALLGLSLCAFSLVGLVALTGVVVNDSLVLVDATNRLRAMGRPLPVALCDAAALRFRPILLTSLTTFLGLLPLLFERAAHADWLKPMAATIAFGLLIATGVTLIVVPVVASVLEDAVSALGRRDRARSLPSLGWSRSGAGS